MTYKEKLRDPRWQKKKGEILIRDNYTCTSCKSTNKNLQVHHLEYFSCDPWEYPNDMLTTLCEDCHGKETGREPLEKELSVSFKMNGFLYEDLHALSCMLYNETAFRNYLLTLIRKFRNG